MTMQYSLNFESIRQRDRGIRRAELSAGDEWNRRALSEFKKWIDDMGSGARFQTESVRAAVSLNLPLVRSERSWGSIPRKAAKMGWIRKVGTGSVSNARAHMAIATVWEVV